MAKLRSILLLFTIFSISANHLARALYEDQVGLFDWKRSFLGKVKHARFDNKRLLVATEENVIASLSTKTGQILWRQLLENPKEQQIHLLHLDYELVTVSGTRNSFYVRGWDPASGSLAYEWITSLERNVDSFWTVHRDQLVHLVPIQGSHLEKTAYNTRTGEGSGRTKKIVAPWIADVSNCATTSSYFACIADGQLYYVNVISDSPKLQALSLQDLLGDDNVGSEVQILSFEEAKPSLLLVLPNNRARLVELEDETIKVLPFDLMSSAVSIDNSIYQLEVNPDNIHKPIKAHSRNRQTGENIQKIDIEYPLGLGGPYIVTGHCKGQACELLLLGTDNSVSLVRLPEGKLVWTREEALSNIVSAEFFELPVSELDASIETEFQTSSNDIISMLSHRLSTQTKQLYNLIFGGQLLADSGLVRDEFGLHKIIVVVTNIGKLFAIDTLSGSIVWSYRLPHVQPFSITGTSLGNGMPLLILRTARHAPHPAQCVLLAQDSNTGHGVLFRFDPITGLSENGIEHLNYSVKQVVVLPVEDQKHLKPISIIAADGSIHFYPQDFSQDLIQKQSSNSVFLYTIESSKSFLQGYKITKTSKLKELWQINLWPSKIVAVSTRPIHERVHSQGRVLPDRSVYYKYVNPNLIALATISEDPVHKHVLSVYLIDGITGLVLYSTSHKRSKGPVHLVHSENWLVYTFFNERFRRNEIVAAELYEGHIQSNSTVFSSFAISQLPHILTQSYILPGMPVSMAVTLTERGITNKFLLIALSSGEVIEIPWMLLQPRFPDIPCGPEESCIPYMPEVPLLPEAIINYNQSLGRIKGIQVAPARLESTSHILVYGLDLFYTRVAPSKTFDVLKEDFDHRLIVLVLTALILTSYVTKQLASKKALRQAWK